MEEDTYIKDDPMARAEAEVVSQLKAMKITPNESKLCGISLTLLRLVELRFRSSHECVALLPD
ncbi:unnamed protein product [Brassica napus]|uniref:(rape) hypothetical protein n=1 Tax=Brassica napus TaxID=3708 RepID=A0A816PRG2_BRANA|nr:unnamed protein product [Brassica napus]